MTIMTWSDSLDIGVAEMNGQHQTLIEIMNRLHDQFEADAEMSEQKKTLEELANFTVKHFGEEEQYMASIDYPLLDTHKRIHANLLEEFGSHKTSFEETGELTTKFFSFLKLWLTAHIQGIDKKYGLHAA